MTFFHRAKPRIVLVLSLLAIGAALALHLFPKELATVQTQFLEFPDSDTLTHALRPYILASICFLPALYAICYSLASILDRYLYRQFLSIFCLCLATLFSIWLIGDLTDKLGDFTQTQNPFATILNFYSVRLTPVFLLLLPYSLLLSLLYCLGKFSSHREIIAMIQAGRGVIRIARPLIITGIFCTTISLGLNYYWAPFAESHVDDILDAAMGKAPTEATQVLFTNPETHRLWMIGAFPPNYQNGQPLKQVDVTITNNQQQLISRIHAPQAFWNRNTRQWTFIDATVGAYDSNKPPKFTRLTDPLTIDQWSETPWQLIKPGLEPSQLGIPDLETWLISHAKSNNSADPSPYRTQWHYRWAAPFSCLITVLLATPLGIHFSRRGSTGGVFLAVVLSALMLFFNTVIIALGESGKLPPITAAWLTNLAFAAIGIFFFHRRISGRPIYQSVRALLLPNSD